MNSLSTSLNMKTQQSVRMSMYVCRAWTMCTRLKFIFSPKNKKVTNSLQKVCYLYDFNSISGKRPKRRKRRRKRRMKQNGCSDYFSSSQISCIVYFSLRKQSCAARAYQMAAVHLNYKTFLNKFFSRSRFSNDAMNSKPKYWNIWKSCSSLKWKKKAKIKNNKQM